MFSALNLTTGSTYNLTCSGAGGSVSRSTTVSVRPSPSATPAPTPTPIPDGRIIGRCIGWPTPHVEIEWSPNPPPGSLPPNENSVLRAINGVEGWFFGGGYPGVNGNRINGAFASAWGVSGYPEPNFTVQDLRDDSVTIGRLYTYAVKYRPEVASLNSYSVFVSSGNCGGPPPGTIPLSVSPQSATTLPNVSVTLEALGGTGLYTWSAPGGTISGVGARVSVVYTNGSLSPVQRTVPSEAIKNSAGRATSVPLMRWLTAPFAATRVARSLTMRMRLTRIMSRNDSR